MTPPYEPDPEFRSQETPDARPEDQQWWSSRLGGEPLMPGLEPQDYRLDESRSDGLVEAGPGGTAQAETAWEQARYESWTPSASGWAPAGGAAAGETPYVPSSARSARGLMDRGLIDLPRPLMDPDTGRSAAYLLGLSVAAGILAALVVLIMTAIAFATLFSGGGG